MPVADLDTAKRDQTCNGNEQQQKQHGHVGPARSPGAATTWLAVAALPGAKPAEVTAVVVAMITRLATRSAIATAQNTLPERQWTERAPVHATRTSRAGRS